MSENFFFFFTVGVFVVADERVRVHERERRKTTRQPERDTAQKYKKLMACKLGTIVQSTFGICTPKFLYSFLKKKFYGSIEFYEASTAK